jgi:hypothetical protein
MVQLQTNPPNEMTNDKSEMENDPVATARGSETVALQYAQHLKSRGH